MLNSETEPAVAVVILNWNATAATLRCLESVTASDWPQLRLIVVDNGSEGEITGAVLERVPDAIVIRTSTNLGFAGGMNVGLRRALELDVEYVLLLNNDTVVHPSMVRRLVEAARSHPDVGIVNPLEFSIEAPDTVAAFGLRCDLDRGYQGPPIGSGWRDEGQLRGVREVDVSTGTAMLVPTPVVREVGLLDEDLFLYIEDVDWAFRMRNAGRRIYAALEAHLWHRGAGSSGGEESPEVRYYHVRNAFVVTDRHAPLRGARALRRSAEILGVNLFGSVRSPQPLDSARAVLQGWRDYRRGRLGPRGR